MLAGDNHLALAQPFLLSIRGGKDGYLRGSAIDDPVQTVTGSSPIAFVQPKPAPFIMQMEHSTDASGHGQRVFPLDAPLRAVTGRAAWGLVEPFIIATNHGRDDARVYSLGETVNYPTPKGGGLKANFSSPKLTRPSHRPFDKLRASSE